MSIFDPFGKKNRTIIEQQKQMISDLIRENDALTRQLKAANTKAARAAATKAPAKKTATKTVKKAAKA